MSTEGLLFIPDISGFSAFVEKTEIEHSRHVIKHLLEALINSNQLQLQVSEIEGDAILFYKFGKPPGITEIYQQVETMFCHFHRLLRSIAVHRLCQCGACKEAEHLTLKIITHQGEFTSYNVKEFSKLIGKDVIKAHQLLKNDIKEHEYWLITDMLYQEDGNEGRLPGWLKWIPGSKQIENDNIVYHYTYLTPLKDQIPEETLFPSALEEGKKEVLSIHKEMKADFTQLFYLVAAPELRPEWMVGVEAVDKMGHGDNLVGVPHRCIFKNGSLVFISSYCKADDTSITYEETTDDKKTTVHYLLQQSVPGACMVTARFYMKENYFKQLMFRFFMKRKMKTDMEKSFLNLERLYQAQIGDTHPHHHHN